MFADGGNFRTVFGAGWNEKIQLLTHLQSQDIADVMGFFTGNEDIGFNGFSIQGQVNS